MQRVTDALVEFARNSALAVDLPELNNCARAIVSPNGYNWFGTTLVRTAARPHSLLALHAFGVPMSAWWERYTMQRYVEDDPAAHVALRSDEPIIEEEVRRQAISTPRVRQIFGEAIEYGVGHGVVCPVRLANGDVWAMGFLGAETNDDPALKAFLMSCARTYTLRAVSLTSSSGNILNGPYRLTPRMREIVTMLRHGETQTTIANTLGISRRTIEHLMHDARERLGVRTTSELIGEAIRIGELGEIP